MEMNIVIGIISGAFMLTGAIALVSQIYQITVLDAKARGLKHPKLWGFLAISGNNSSGLIMYLIGRRKYPIINISETTRNYIERKKKIAGVGLVFLAAVAIGLFMSMLLMP